MAVLMRLANGQGQCDRRCYDAEHERCHCQVCGGLMHGIGKQQAIRMRMRLLKTLDQQDRVGEEQPYWVDETKRRQQESVILIERRINQRVIKTLRAPARVRAQIAAGQLPLFKTEGPRFARPRHR